MRAGNGSRRGPPKRSACMTSKTSGSVREKRLLAMSLRKTPRLQTKLRQPFLPLQLKKSRLLPLGCLVPDADPLRRTGPGKRQASLQATVERYGVLEPLLVRPLGESRYRIVAGERRYRAALAAGLTELPCIVRDWSDQDAAIVSLIENLHREACPDIDKSDFLQRLKQETGRTWVQLADWVGLSHGRVRNLSCLQRLAPQVKAAMRSGRIAGRTAIALVPLNPKEQAELLEEAICRRLTSDQVRALVAQQLRKSHARVTSRPPVLQRAERLRNTVRSTGEYLSADERALLCETLSATLAELRASGR